MLACQRSLFELPEDVHYLNGAYMSPQLKSVTAVGMTALARKAKPYEVFPSDYFEGPTQLKKQFARLIHAADYRRIAVIPSVSYGMATVAANIRLQPGEEILVLEEQFPSNYYSWQRLAEEQGAVLRKVGHPNPTEQLLEGISEKTRVLAISHNHWADGHLLDLKALRAATRRVGALMIIDGTQSVGALPFDVSELDPDALICAGYKWLMGPYSIGVAYFGPYFDEGKPIEENWLNRQGSENFQGLVNYTPGYQPLAGRYSMGEQSNFVLAPMLAASIGQLLDWGVESIQDYSRQLTAAPLAYLQDLGVGMAEPNHRPGHLVGLHLPMQRFDRERLQALLKASNVHVSWRGDAIRISTHVYNTPQDWEVLVNCIEQSTRTSV